MFLKQGKYVFNSGISVRDICQKYECPLYVYEGDIIQKKFELFQNAFDVKNLGINYACKALSNINILKLMRKLGAGLDTVSIQEVRMGLAAGFEPKEIIYTPNCVSIDELISAASLGVKINIDSLPMLEHFGELKAGYPICIRINPHVLAGGNSKISTGHIDSKFGISIHQLPLVKRIEKALGLNIEGIHMHTGSEILDSEVFLFSSEILLNAAKKFDNLRYIDFGSGFKVSYKNDGIETDVKDVGEKLSKRFNQFCKEYGSELSLIFEPGKFLVSESGTFFASVNVIKQTTSTVFAGIDSGFNHLIRPMFYDAYHNIVNISNPEGRKRIYTIVGYICETDTFGVNRKLSELRERDIIAIQNAGAYCFTMSSNYNSRFRPAEVLIYNGNDYLIRERENFEDLIYKQKNIEIN